jgi:aminoglycoside phosphotransferase (APT) family kinase protein
MWHDLIDLAALGSWMDRRGLGAGQVEGARALGGGTQNVLLFFERAGRPYVLRRPPPVPRPGSDDTIRREIRVLGALAGTAVPHPGLIAGCGDAAVLGTAFYLMEPVDGFNATVAMPALHAGDAGVRRAMGLALVDGIAALGRVDHVAVGLADFGKPDGFLRRQTARWLGQLEGYRASADWPGPGGLPGVARVAAWLERHRPAAFTPGIMHGDFHLANVMFRPDGPGLAAIVDWELATIGDPLLDLGWLLATWPETGAPETGAPETGAPETGAPETGAPETGVPKAGVPKAGVPDSGTPRERAAQDWAIGVTPWDGFPTAAELIARYRSQSARDLSAIDWYAVLACFKLGIILEGTYARACAGAAPRATGDRLHAHAVGLFERAGHWIAGGRS